MRTLAACLVVASAVAAQDHHRKENQVLLGIVAVPVPTNRKHPKIVLAHVLKKSPAAKAGLETGDEILELAGQTPRSAPDIDAALARFSGGESIEIVYRRDKKKRTTTAKLIERKKYRGDFLERPRRGETGYVAPDWFLYSWTNGGKEPPTRANTKGKVVVIHCFQSW